MIRIDAREKELIQLIQPQLVTYPHLTLSIESLPLGDCILEKSKKPDNNVIDESDNNNNNPEQKYSSETVIIERKTINDLLSSIKDGRYAEQSFRLNGFPIHNHNIVYLIEGDINRIQSSNKQIVYSAMFSLNYFKGFSVMRTMSLLETSIYICSTASKLAKEKRCCFYNTPGTTTTDMGSSINADIVHPYSSVVKQVKKENVTPQNMGEIMLCQIPGISHICALAIMKQFGSLPNLIADLQELGTDCLVAVSYTNAKGQIRKLNKPTIINVGKYLNI